MIVINLPFPISVNRMFADGRTRRIKSSVYQDWIQEAGLMLNRQHPGKINSRVRLIYQFQDEIDGRRRDVGNLEKGVTDLLVKHGVIDGDDNRFVREIYLLWDKDVVGVRVRIEQIAEQVAA